MNSALSEGCMVSAAQGTVIEATLWGEFADTHYDSLEEGKVTFLFLFESVEIGLPQSLPFCSCESVLVCMAWCPDHVLQA